MSIRLFTYRSSLRLLLPIIAFAFSSAAGISVAAWLDAPNAPPNYGISAPNTQEYFMPMNLSASPQTKLGEISASAFIDNLDANYKIDPASTGYAGIFKGLVGIGQRYPAASLAVNNGAEVTGKTGSPGDAIYAYAAGPSTTAISAEQADPAGYAIYASGGINFFGGDVQVGSAVSPKNLCLNGDCKTAWPSVSGGIANYLTKWTGATALGNSVIYDNGTNVGVGTATPNQKLEVDGNAKTTGYVSGVNLISGGYRLDITPVITYGPWQPNWLCCGGGPGFADSCDTQSLATYSCSGTPKACKDTANQEQVYGTTGCPACGWVGGYYRDIDCGTTATVNSATWTGQ